MVNYKENYILTEEYQNKGSNFGVSDCKACTVNCHNTVVGGGGFYGSIFFGVLSPAM